MVNQDVFGGSGSCGGRHFFHLLLWRGLNPGRHKYHFIYGSCPCLGFRPYCVKLAESIWRYITGGGGRRGSVRTAPRPGKAKWRLRGEAGGRDAAAPPEKRRAAAAERTPRILPAPGFCPGSTILPPGAFTFPPMPARALLQAPLTCRLLFRNRSQYTLPGRIHICVQRLRARKRFRVFPLQRSPGIRKQNSSSPAPPRQGRPDRPPAGRRAPRCNRGTPHGV